MSLIKPMKNINLAAKMRRVKSEWIKKQDVHNEALKQLHGKKY